MHPHTMTARVYYADTDCGGVVYYANYLKYMEAGRTEFMRTHGADLADLHRQGIMFAVTEAHVKYRAPARYNDLLTIETRLLQTSSVILTFENTIISPGGILLVKAETKLACINDKGRAVRIPAMIHERLGSIVSGN